MSAEINTAELAAKAFLQAVDNMPAKSRVAILGSVAQLMVALELCDAPSHAVVHFPGESVAARWHRVDTVVDLIDSRRPERIVCHLYAGIWCIDRTSYDRTRADVIEPILADSGGWLIVPEPA